MKDAHWPCIECRKVFFSHEDWMAHVNGSPKDCTPPPQRPPLTEADVRRIVREELAKMPDPIQLRTFGGKP